MSFFYNLKIGPRLGVAFATVIALAAVVVVIGITRLSDLNDSLNKIGERPPAQGRADWWTLPTT
jgi:methyl-accepting chemotaxis protein